MCVTRCETFYTYSLEICRVSRPNAIHANRKLAVSPFSVPYVDSVGDSSEIETHIPKLLLMSERNRGNNKT
jgi:hypothetical protein